MLFARRAKQWPLPVHVALLVLFALAMIGVWMLPTLLVGYPYVISGMIPRARDYVETGVLVIDSMRLETIILGLLYPLIGLKNIVGWTAVSAMAFAAALIPWWFFVRRLFDIRIAWISTVIMSFMPTYWVEAVRLEGYPFAFFFLFLSFAAFLRFFPKRPALACILSGLCFGAAIASRDAFLLLLPWFVFGYLWHNHKRWVRALVHAGLYCACAYITFALPLFPNALQDGMSPKERVMVFLPSLEHGTPGEGHLYPDQYAYDFLREEFNKRIVEHVEDSSFIVRQQDENYRYIFGVGDVTPSRIFISGLWLTVNALPEFFLLDTVGGVFLWLFIIPGMAYCLRNRRWVLMEWIGLWLSTEFLLRFVLHFSRSHLTDIGWALPLFAALGVSMMATAVAKNRKKLPVTFVMAGITLIIAGQMLQANRKQFAAFYARSSVPEIYAATEALDAVPADAVVAHPRRSELFSLSDRTPVTLHPDTLDYLAEEGRAKEPLEYYGVTHAIGYDAEQAAIIKQADPRIQILEIPEHSPGVTVTPLMQYLLHQIR